VKIVVDTKEFDKACALVQEWERRARAVRRQFLYYAARDLYNDVLSFMPADRKTLRQSMVLESVRGLPDSEDAYVIRSVSRGRKVTEDNADTSAIYISAKTNLMERVPEATLILQEFSPWTLDTIPYTPDSKTAESISRRVSPREITRIRKLRKRDRPVWRRRMKKEGIREMGTNFEPRPRGMITVPDTAFESLRLEFGIGGSPSKPHWRKAILKLVLRGAPGMISKKPEFVRAMMDPKFHAWEMWPKHTSGYVSTAVAKRYVPFQKRLGIRVSR